MKNYEYMGKKYTCDVEAFTAKMHEKYPDHVKITGNVETLADESLSNTILMSSRVDPGEVASIVAGKVKEWKKLGKIRTETWEEGTRDESVEGFLTLKDPCDENLLKQAIDEDFLWED
jgi:hypothetical protein